MLIIEVITCYLSRSKLIFEGNTDSLDGEINPHFPQSRVGEKENKGRGENIKI